MARPLIDFRFAASAAALLVAAVCIATAPPAPAQTFVSQGPGLSIGPASTIQSNDAPPNGTMGAAIQAVLPHPTDANTMYVGGTNGGIWVTRNGGASWTPLSDKQRSLSIASLAFDPTDASRGTLIAGVGITSNGLVGSTGSVEDRGGQRIGVLYSSNGGASWNELGGAALANKSIVGVAARGSTLLAAAAEPHDAAAAGGLYRSVNGGSSFDLVSGTRGLASGPVSSLASDAANSSVFFAAVSATVSTRAATAAPTGRRSCRSAPTASPGWRPAPTARSPSASTTAPKQRYQPDPRPAGGDPAFARRRRLVDLSRGAGHQPRPAGVDRFRHRRRPDQPRHRLCRGRSHRQRAVHRDGLPRRATGRRHLCRRNADRRRRHGRLDHACRCAHAGLRRAGTNDPGRRRRSLLPHQSRRLGRLARAQQPVAVAARALCGGLRFDQPAAGDVGAGHRLGLPERPRQLDLPRRRRRRRRRQCRGQRHDLARAGRQRDLHDLAEPGAADAPGGRRQRHRAGHL